MSNPTDKYESSESLHAKAHEDFFCRELYGILKYTTRPFILSVVLSFLSDIIMIIPTLSEIFDATREV